MSGTDDVRVRSFSHRELALSPSGANMLHPSYVLTTQYRDQTPGKSTFSVWANDASRDEHQCIDQTHLRVGGRYITGGILKVAHVEHSAKPIMLNYSSIDPTAFSVYALGDVRPCFAGAATNLPSMTVDPNIGSIASYGATGWRKFCPGRPKVDLATALVELRDLPGMLKGRLESMRDLGSAYLNVQFGWAPLLRDIMKSVKLAADVNSELERLRAGNGKWLLRKGTVTSERANLSSWDTYPGYIGIFTPSLSSWIANSSTHSSHGSSSYGRDVWFSGRFRYFIPGIDKNPGLWERGWKRDTMRKLYGLSVTPAQVWELIPWSWLVDWFSNAGDVVANISGGAVDAVAKYAYVMGTTYHIAKQTSTAYLKNGACISGVVMREALYKERVSASPFGFSLSWDDLDPRQLAILTALGISRS